MQAPATEARPAPTTDGPVATRVAPSFVTGAPSTMPAEWAGLYRLGGLAAVLTALLIPVAILAHVVWPPPSWAPGAAGDWFEYLQASQLAGLLNLDLGMAVGLVVAVPLYLALFVALRDTSRSAMLVATALALLGTVLHLVANSAFEMLAFSQAHAAATSDAERTVYLAAGEAALSAYYGSVFQVSYVLGYLAYIVIGAVMLRSAAFGRTLGILGIVTGVVGFGFYLPAIGLALSVFVVLLIGAWNVLVARRLFALADGSRAAQASPPSG